MLARFFFASASGWVAVILIGLTIWLAYILRSANAERILRQLRVRNGTFVEGMLAHIWLGYLILALALAHAVAAMSLPEMARGNQAGLWFATLAFALLLIQVAFGRQLAQPTRAELGALRRSHFLTMCGIVATVLGHVAFNSSVVRLVFQ